MTNYTAQDRTPFTYYIEWSTLNKSYYGVRYALGCQPSDLMTIYFTSSNIVKEYITLYGLPDISRIDRVFNNKFDAINYEHFYLKENNAAESDMYLNQTNGGNTFYNISVSEIAKTKSKKTWEEKIKNGFKFSIERNAKILNTHYINSKLPNYVNKNIGKERTSEFKLQQSKRLLNYYKNGGICGLHTKRSEEWKLQHSARLKKMWADGYKETEFTIAKRKATNKEKIKNGYVSPLKNVKKSVEIKDKISTSKIEYYKNNKSSAIGFVNVYDIKTKKCVQVTKEDYKLYKNEKYLHPTSNAYKDIISNGLACNVYVGNEYISPSKV